MSQNRRARHIERPEALKILLTQQSPLQMEAVVAVFTVHDPNAEARVLASRPGSFEVVDGVKLFYSSVSTVDDLALMEFATTFLPITLIGYYAIPK